MKRIFDFPYNEDTQYIDPDYRGGSNAGFFKRIDELKDGNYRTWNADAPVETVNDLMENISKFADYYDYINGNDQVSLETFYQYPLVVAYKKLIDSETISAADTDSTAATITHTASSFTTGDKIALNGMDGTWGVFEDTYDFYADVVDTTNTKLRVGATDGPYLRFYNKANADTSSTAVDVSDEVVITVDDASEFNGSTFLTLLTDFDGTLSRYNNDQLYIEYLTSTTVKPYYDLAKTNPVKLIDDPDQTVTNITVPALTTSNTQHLSGQGSQLIQTGDVTVSLQDSQDYFNHMQIDFHPNGTNRLQDTLSLLPTSISGRDQWYFATTGSSKVYKLYWDEALTAQLYPTDIYNNSGIYSGYQAWRPSAAYTEDQLLPSSAQYYLWQSTENGNQLENGNNEILRFTNDVGGIRVTNSDYYSSALLHCNFINEVPDASGNYTRYSGDNGLGKVEPYTSQAILGGNNKALFTDASGYLFEDVSLTAAVNDETFALEIDQVCKTYYGDVLGYQFMSGYDSYFFDNTPVYDDTSAIQLNDPDGEHFGYFTLGNTADEDQLLADLDKFFYKDRDWTIGAPNGVSLSYLPAEETESDTWNKIVDTGYTKGGKRLFKMVDRVTGAKKKVVQNIADHTYTKPAHLTYEQATGEVRSQNAYTTTPESYYAEVATTKLGSGLTNPLWDWCHAEYTQYPTDETRPYRLFRLFNQYYWVKVMRPALLQYALAAYEIGPSMTVGDQVNINSTTYTVNWTGQTYDDVSSPDYSRFGDHDTAAFTTVNQAFDDNVSADTPNYDYTEWALVTGDPYLVKSGWIECIRYQPSGTDTGGSLADIGEEIIASTTGHLSEVKSPDDTGQIVRESPIAATQGQIAIATDDPYRYELSSADLMINGNQVYKHLTAEDTYTFAAEVDKQKYYEAFASFPVSVRDPRYVDALGETMPDFTVTVDASGYLDSVTLVTGAGPEGKFSNKNPICLFIQSPADTYTPTALSVAQQQDVYDTDDEWNYTTFDSAKVWPSTVSPARINWEHDMPSSTSYSMNGKKYARTSGYQKMQLEVTYPPLTPAQFAELAGFAQAMQGQVHPVNFPLLMDNGKYLLAVDNAPYNFGNRYIREAAAAGDTVIHVHGYASGEENACIKGEMIRIAGNVNGGLYTVVNTANANEYGEVKIRLSHPLNTSLSVGQTVVHRPERVTVTLAEDGFIYGQRLDGFYDLTVTFETDEWKG